jgi:phage-related protein
VKESRAEIDFRGDSLEVLSLFPVPVKTTFRYNLRRLQNGEDLLCSWRSMPSVGRGVVELKEQDARTWYRLMYLTQVEGVIYVLHCFEKSSPRTDKRDIENRSEAAQRSEGGDRQKSGKV